MQNSPSKKSQRFSPQRKKNGYYTARLEVRFLDIYEIKVRDLETQSTFQVELEQKRISIGQSHKLVVNSNMRSILFFVIQEGESSGSPMLQIPQLNNSSDDISVNGIGNTPPKQQQSEEIIKKKPKSYFELNVGKMMATCLDERQKVKNKHQQFEEYIPIYEKVQEVGQKYADKKEVFGYVQLQSILDFNIRDELRNQEE